MNRVARHATEASDPDDGDASVDHASALLGGLSPAAFMRKHWQKKPLVVRGAVPEAAAIFDRRRLFTLAARDDVESRLVARGGERWSLRAGPITRRGLPPLSRPGWTLLVQGVDLHDDAVHALLQRFRFVPDARLDDAMISFASSGGGVGPHVDSYDVFLLQLSGTRVWRVGELRGRRAAALRDDVPLKMLAAFRPKHEWRLDAGDMLYLPPGWGHDGIADGPCLTCSIGFRAPAAPELAGELLQRIEVDGLAGDDQARRYADPGQAAAAHPARVPKALQRYADAAVTAAVRDRQARQRALGEWLSEPKAGTWFERASPATVAVGGEHAAAAIALDRRTRMLWDDTHVFVNGEAFVVGGADAKLMRRLADRRCLSAHELRRAGADVRRQLATWCEAGWCRRLRDEEA